MDTVDEIVGFEEPGDEVDRLAYEMIGAAIEVHRALGPGYLESAYAEALCHELTLRGIACQREFEFSLQYKGWKIGKGRIDLLVGGRLVVELKACEALAPIHTAQAISYLKATGLRLARLINFNVRRLKDGVKRIASTS